MRASTRWNSMLCIAMGWVAFGVAQAAEPAPTKAPVKAPAASQQETYNACFKQANDRKLDGKARLDFMSQCMQVKMPSGTVYN